ncbi:Transthyretin-like family-containing protein [Aphelenchoides besseyi]|nr:Transthyretin-like family-containing protein [Aphelenchoides besseyi]
MLSASSFTFVCGILLFLCNTSTAAVNSVAVKGHLNCGKVPANDVTVVLYRNSTKEVSQTLDSRTTSPMGLFEVTGNTNGRPLNETEIAPVIRFFHRCAVDEKTKKGNMRSFEIGVPQSFISAGVGKPKKTFDIGTLNLELTYPKESWEKDARP